MRIFKYSIVLLIAFGAILACKRDYVGNYLAPEMKAASSDFRMVDSLKTNYFNGVAFEKGKISFSRDSATKVLVNGILIKGPTLLAPRNTFFTAHFNESAKWTITIVGSVSQAQKTLTGVSTFLDSSNVDAIWDGNSDNGYYFIPTEKATATLTILGSEQQQSISFIIARTIAYKANSAVLLNDFEGGFSLITYGDDLDPFGNPAPDTRTDIVPPQGRSSMVIEGTDHNGDYFIGGYQQPLDSSTFLGKSPSDIYINMYIYGFGPEKKLTPNATKLNIGVSEDDNQNGAFDPEKEDSFEQQVNVDWQGWKLVSIRYSNLKPSSSSLNGGNGNKNLEPSKAVSISANLISSPNGSTVGTALDYMIVSFGKPYSK